MYIINSFFSHATCNGLIQNDIITYSTCIGMILAMLLKIVYIPMVAQYIIQRAKKRLPTQPLALQWHDPTKELRVLLCFHGPENVSCAINFMEISKGKGEPGILVYATDMIELTDQIAATLVPGGIDNVEVTDKTVVETREKLPLCYKNILSIMEMASPFEEH